MNFQVTVLKVLVSYPDGFAAIADLKRDVAILATSGRDWAERTRRLAARVPGLDIFSQGLVERLNGGWCITDKGRSVLEIMEAQPHGRGANAGHDSDSEAFDNASPAQAGTKAAAARRGTAKTSERVVGNIGWALTSSLVFGSR